MFIYRESWLSAEVTNIISKSLYLWLRKGHTVDTCLIISTEWVENEYSLVSAVDYALLDANY